MSCMGRCGVHGTTYTAIVRDGQRWEHCPECRAEQAERQRDEAYAVLQDVVAFKQRQPISVYPKALKSRINAILGVWP